MRSLPKLKLKSSKKIHPGVSSFAQNVESVGRDHLQSLINMALDEVPPEKVAETPIFLLATAGVRFLPKNQQSLLLQSVCSYLQSNTRFDLPDCDTRVQVISGETEGILGWIATNYLLGGFDRPQDHRHGKGHHTYGFLDMGGASAQIAFAPNSTEADRHSDDLKLIRMRRLDGSPVEYKVFTTTWLGFGANKARSRYVQSLQESYGDTTEDIPDPCLPKGLRTHFDGSIVVSKSSNGQRGLVGTGLFDECLKKTYPLLQKDAPCEDHPCLLNGQHVPAIDFDVNHFIGVSEYWHTTHGIFGKEHNAYDLASYQHTVMEFCGRDWQSIKSDLDTGKKADKKLQDAQEACFKASWLINVLYEGIGIPRLGVEPVPRPGINITQDATDKAKSGGFLDPFQPVDKIEGVEVSWTLGKILLYAAGQIKPSPEASALPVGFGSNLGSKTPSDFEQAGSKPLPTSSFIDTEDSDDDIPATSNHSLYGISLILLILILLAYLFRKPEFRRRLCNSGRWRRPPSATRKPKRGFLGAVGRLFGGNAANYERILEEGEAANEFELDVNSEEFDYSDGSDGSRPLHAGLGAPKLNLERFDDSEPQSAIDRKGLVIRTESRERLTRNLQMLNAGRRSRAGSPTRLKSPLVIPLQNG